MSSVLTLKDYFSLIKLQPIVQTAHDNVNYHWIVNEIFQYFSGSYGSPTRPTIEEQRAFIRRILTMRDPLRNRYSDSIYQLIDQMLIYERNHMKALTDALSLPIQFPAFPYIRVWRGDITTLAVDAIVNAANSGLLGCFQPTHLCIDNVIHAAAGPRLRDDCHIIMTKQRLSEPVGHAKITLGYNLPAKYVLHTVGPQLDPGSRVTGADARALASCYESCLNVATELNTIKSIAFCCISTGIFCFPADYACRIAIETVINWFQRRNSSCKISLIIFDVFNQEDEQRYHGTLKHFSK